MMRDGGANFVQGDGRNYIGAGISEIHCMPVGRELFNETR
jgi:hypothetical protein